MEQLPYSKNEIMIRVVESSKQTRENDEGEVHAHCFPCRDSIMIIRPVSPLHPSAAY
jgi:hypothetical protein